MVGSRRPSVWHDSLISLSRPMAIPNSRITKFDESRMLLFILTLAQAVSIPEPKKQGGNSPLLLKSRGDFQKEGGISRKGSLLKKILQKT